MDPIRVEISAHRIAGSDRYERTFMPMVAMVYEDGRTVQNLPGLLFSNALLSVDIARVQPVRAGLFTAEMMLSDVNMSPICRPRPVLISTMPSDVPLYSTHVATDPEHGVYTVGLRVPTIAWLPEHLAPADPGTLT